MAFGEFYVQRECWAKWPNVLWMVRKRGGGNERRRYLPERTCRIFPKPSDSDFVDDWHYLCSECGHEIPVYERNPDDYRLIISHANYCPNCGAKVVE